MDDGTAVLSIQHNHALDAGSELNALDKNTGHDKADFARPDKGKKRALDTHAVSVDADDLMTLRRAPPQDWSGVPPEYWPREPPKPPSGRKTAGHPDAAERERTGAAAAAKAYVDVGHVVRVCGRVKRFPWGVGLEVGKNRWGKGGGGFVGKWT